MIYKNKTAVLAVIGIVVALSLGFFVFSDTNTTVAFDGPPGSAGVGSGAFAVNATGSVAIATSTFSSSKLRVAGSIESTTGGFIFPDGSTQTTASLGTATTSAGYITPGVFNSVQGTGGNYEFPASIVLSSTTAVGDGVIYKDADSFIHDFAKPGTFGRNTFVGVNSGNFTMTGSSLSNGSYNTAIGYSTLTSNMTGGSNTAVGYESLYSNTGGTSNTATGYLSLFTNATGDFNVANGFKALYLNTTGIHNVANGTTALYSNTSGYFNTATGDESLFYNTTGWGNTAAGHYSLYTNATGTYNVANGNESLFWNTGGSRNVAAGSFSLHNNTRGNDNIAIGDQSLYQNTTANLNTAIGTYSLFSNTTGAYNTAVGPYSGYNDGTTLSTMSSTTFLGSGANSSANAISNSTAIGAGSQVTKSNQVVLGNTAVTETLLNGSVGIGTSTAPAARLDVNVANMAGNPIAFALTDASSLWYMSLARCNGCFATGAAAGDLVLRSANSKDFILTTDNGTTATLAATAANNIGVGTSAPTSQLQVSGAAGTVAPVRGGGTLYMYDTGGAPDNGGAIVFGAGTANTTFAGIKGLLKNGASNTVGDLAFYTRNTGLDSTLTERMRMTWDGKIGMGTTTPKKLLHLDSSSTTLYMTNSTASKGATIILEDTDGAGCTGITALNGVLTAAIVACP
jgi:hypothetical protein